MRFLNAMSNPQLYMGKPYFEVLDEYNDHLLLSDR